MTISSIQALEILDSRALPTLCATVTLADGTTGWAAVPSGASTGSYEAVELRDGGTRYNGKGVLQAVKNVNDIIAPALHGLDITDQAAIDRAMIALDGTRNKAKLGANAILAVSLACAQAAAKSQGLPLYHYLTKFNPDFDGTYVMPAPMMNVMNGGKHAAWATDIQEYMIMPVSAQNVTDAVRMCAEVYNHLKKILQSKGYATHIGDEGGFAPAVSSNAEPFQLLSEAIGAAGYALGTDFIFAIDAAASEFFHDGAYELKREGTTVSSAELAAFYQGLREQYPIRSFEDIFAEDDWQSFTSFTAALEGTAQVVGDDLYVTNVERLRQGIGQKATNSILIKLNQIGTLTETVDAILEARRAGMTAVVSHRSGETEDTFIADFVVAMGTGQIKTGAPCRSERTAKYNRLMAIEADSKGRSAYARFPF